MGEEVGDDGDRVAVVGEDALGEFDHGGVGAETTGVAIEGWEADFLGGKVELAKDGLVGGWVVVDDRLIEATAEVGVGFFKN